MDDIYTELSSRAGHGYAFGLNAGIKLKIPLPTKNRFSPYFYLAATAEDIGNTTFKAIGSQLPPTSIKQSFNFQAYGTYKINIDSKDYKSLIASINNL